MLIKFLTLTILFSCVGHANQLENLKKTNFTLPNGEQLNVYLAQTLSEQKLGLSGIKDDEFNDDEAMLFVYDTEDYHQFWMPNTFFNLDIIFLTKEFYVIDIHRSLQHFPAEGPKDEIPRSKVVHCRHILEIKSSSPLAQKIQIGSQLKGNLPSPH